MKDIPIIFSAPMILALLAGRKTMTRRLARRERRRRITTPTQDYIEVTRPMSSWDRVKPGDRLWVRENLCAMANWGLWHAASDAPPSGQFLDDIDARGRAILERYAPTEATDSALVPSIYMPRWASRLTLIVTATKIERLQEISEADALAEGAPWYVYGHGIISDAEYAADPGYQPNKRMGFCSLWNTLHGESAWNENPEVCAISFSVHKSNIDALPKEEAA